MRIWAPKSILNQKALISVHEDLAATLIRQGAVTTALTHLDRSMQLRDRNPRTLVMIAHCHWCLENYAQAIVFFDATLEIDSQNTFALTGKGDALLKQKKFFQARTVLERAYFLDPNCPYTKVLLNECYQSLKAEYSANNDLDMAYCYTQLSLKLFPEDLDTLHERGLICDRLGYFFNAIQSFKQVLQSNPNHFDSLANLGSTLRKVGKLTESLQTLGRANAQKPHNSFVQRETALTQLSYFN